MTRTAEIDIPQRASQKTVISTIGHSNRTLTQFVDMLKAFDIAQVIDVRKLPRSRSYPHFNYEALPVSLEEFNINYVHMPGLTGLRKAAKDSPNTGWRNKSFQAFADYMQTPEFDESIEELITLARSQSTAVMCSEAVPWRCHRSLIADALVVREIEVHHILSTTRASTHAINDFAKVDGSAITYPEAPT
jgi:uncharacterized protein (DUF488 family)